MTDFVHLAETLDKVTAVSSRTQKITLIAEFIRLLEANEISIAVSFLSGRVFAEVDQRSLNISWSGLFNSLKQIMEFDDSEFSSVYQGDAGEAVAKLAETRIVFHQTSLVDEKLTIRTVGESLDRIAAISGKGSKKEKETILVQLFSNSSPREMKYLVAIILGDLRTGASEGIVAEAVAKAFSAEAKLVRRAWQFSGNLGEIAHIAFEKGVEGLANVTIRKMSPVKPMLASPIDNLEEILETGPLALEIKFDGARVQIHKEDADVKIFSRKLLDVTESLPEIDEIVRGLDIDSIVLDGEVVAVDSTGKPYPFQVVMRRFGRTRDVESTSEDIRLLLFLFDLISIDGKPMVDLTYEERRKRLEKAVPSKFLTERIVTDDIEKALAFFERSKEEGHEGLVAKKLDSPYLPGTRGKNWLKIKHTLDTMDMVVIGAEWGHGRRAKWLSDYHLGVLDDETGEFVMVGKTYKGLTDKELEQMTKRLLEIKIGDSRRAITVTPEIVVEILASEIQVSPTYKQGLALRFARIVRIREDKGPQDIIKLSELKSIFEKQFKFKARPQ